MPTEYQQKLDTRRTNQKSDIKFGDMEKGLSTKCPLKVRSSFCVSLWLTWNLLDFSSALFAVYDLFDKVAVTVFNTLLHELGIDFRSLHSAYSDPTPLAPNTLATSVFNVYYYLNNGPTESSSTENCVQHVDPGYITVRPFHSFSA